MSSASSAVTYTSVYTDSEPGRVFWGAGEELSDGGSLRVIVYRHDGLPVLPVAPPSPDYVPGPEESQTPPAPQDEDEHEPMFIQPHDPDFVPKPIYTEYIPLEDEHVLSAEEQPLPHVVSPIAESPEYVVESDPEEYEDDETEDGPVERLLAMPTPSPSPLASLSPPSAGERLARCTAPAALLSPPLPPPLHMPPPVDHRDDIPETEMLPRKRDTWVDPTNTVPEIVPMTVGEVKTRVTELAELHEHDTHDLYTLLEDAQDSRTRISQRVIVDSQRVDLLMEDRIAHQETIQIMEDEAYVEIVPMTVGEVKTRVTELAELHEHDTHDLYTLLEDAQDKLRETDRRHQAQMVETLRVMGDMRREIGDMHAELLALHEQPRRARQL
nr:hypothetical protein [Tanacetum cinerariifolium]